MGSSEAEGSSSPTMVATIDELKKGSQSAATLATLLLVDPMDSPIAKLLEEIMSSISKAISALEYGKSLDLDSPSGVTSKAPGEKRKNQSTSKAANRKRGHPYCWTRVTSSTIEDGHTWRKYGQKEIFSAKHPRYYFAGCCIRCSRRSYYRCTYKFDRGCKARRQVQKSEDNPCMYVITYFGEHTCLGERDNNPRCREPCVISFESSKVNDIKQEIPFSSFPSQKKESEEEVVSKLTSSDSPSNCFEPPEIELQKPSMIGLEPDWSDSLPSLNSSMTSYDLAFMDLDDIIEFDQNVFFTW